MTDLNLKIRVSVEPESTWDGTGIAGIVVKSVDERRYTLTVAYPANKPDIGVARDQFRDFAGADTVEDAAWNYMIKSRNVGAWHEAGTDGAGDVVESYIYRGPDWTVTAADGSTQVIKAGDWLLGVRWNEDTWTRIKSGEIGGVSPQGRAFRRVPDPVTVAGLRS
jgi:hypothetical protein